MVNTEAERGDTGSMEWINNRHCWSYDLRSFTISQITYSSFSATAVFIGLQVKC